MNKTQRELLNLQIVQLQQTNKVFAQWFEMCKEATERALAEKDAEIKKLQDLLSPGGE